MGREAQQLVVETFAKNMIDKDEYPQTAEIEMRRWCFLTAYDPDSQQLDNEENEDCNRQLVEHVRLCGCIVVAC